MLMQIEERSLAAGALQRTLERQSKEMLIGCCGHRLLPSEPQKQVRIEANNPTEPSPQHVGLLRSCKAGFPQVPEKPLTVSLSKSKANCLMSRPSKLQKFLIQVPASAVVKNGKTSCLRRMRSLEILDGDPAWKA